MIANNDGEKLLELEVLIKSYKININKFFYGIKNIINII